MTTDQIIDLARFLVPVLAALVLGWLLLQAQHEIGKSMAIAERYAREARASACECRQWAQVARGSRKPGEPCAHVWMTLPTDPPGYRAPCLFCDALRGEDQ